MYNWETFQTAYQAASAEKKAVVDTETIPMCVKGVVVSKQLDNSHYTKLVRLYALFLLGAVSEQLITEEMRKLGIPDGKGVLDALEICREKTPATQESDLSSDIAEAEAALQTIPPPVRTMSKDMAQAQNDKEVTYSSTQAAILKESEPPVPQPIPKWDNAAK